MLAADLAAVYDCLFSNEALLDKLFAFLEREAPLNSLLAGYFGKIVSVLLSRRTDETLKVMDDKKVVPLLLRHLGAYSILELLLKVPPIVPHPLDDASRIATPQPSAAVLGWRLAAGGSLGAWQPVGGRWVGGYERHLLRACLGWCAGAG